MCMKIGMADLNCIVEIIYSSNDQQTAFQEQAKLSFKDHKMYKVKYLCLYWYICIDVKHIYIATAACNLFYTDNIYIKILREKMKDSYSKFIHETWVINLSNSKCLNFPWMYINQALQWISKAIYINLILLLWSQIDIYFVLEGAVFL